MKLGIALGALNPARFERVVLEAERLGFESVWLPEHLVFPMEMSGSPMPGVDHPPIPATTPVFDVFAMLSYFAGITERIRLGTNVYLLGLRHPFVSARAIQTFDIVSGGRAEIGIGAGWLREEWRAAGLDPATRGRRLDECIDVCKRLWTEPVIAHAGDFHPFEPVAFEPKPVQKPHPPLHIGGESPAAYDRAARRADGWLGLAHDLISVRAPIQSLTSALARCDRTTEGFEITIMAEVGDRETLRAYADLGVTRIIAAPWRRSSEAIDGLRAYARALL